ncbi:MAG: hypothetical protein KAH05_00275, partial [Clostridiales bacterium]|nr:hypothetical protein [Clostridiales bacterium]
SRTRKNVIIIVKVKHLNLEMDQVIFFTILVRNREIDIISSEKFLLIVGIIFVIYTIFNYN